ncbi:hypothetical protein B0H13DRAFT_1896210 [Mycena leptocephala]|nr:hypothetical protein B0H13DRAFT_1896210 [Mycena leptocephala]
MWDSHLDWIWSRYTSPDPASGMQSLYQMCSAFTKHVLQPSHIIMRGGGFTLHLELAVPLTDVITSMDRLLYLAAKHIQLRSAPCIGQQELRTLTVTEGLHACATYNQVVYGWVTLINRLARVMRELQWLCIGEDPSQYSWSSWMPGILASLPPSLRAKLPSNFLELYKIMMLPSPANTSQVSRQKAAFVENVCRHRAEVVLETMRPESISAELLMHCETRKLTSSPCVSTFDCSAPSQDLSIADVFLEVTGASDSGVSLSSRAADIANKKSLEASDIVDRGVDVDHLYIGRFGL